MTMLSILALLTAPMTGPVTAQEVVQPLTPSGWTADGRYFGHLPYAEVANDALAGFAQSLSPDKSCQLHRDAAASLYRLMGAATVAGVDVRLISCFRSRAHQETIFCGAGAIGACRDPADRSQTVAPPGYSEHVTGYTVDFGVASYDGCADLNPCMAATAGGQWLIANAPRFGFELSFPPGNKQGVSWEPWHWRWVGITASEPGAAAARAVFARARRDYPARPAIVDAPPPPVRLRPVNRSRFTGPRD